jgi:hypothetical protein
MKWFTGSYGLAPETDCFISIGATERFHAGSSPGIGVPTSDGTRSSGYLTAAPIATRSLPRKIRTGDYLIEPVTSRVDRRERLRPMIRA